MQFKHFVSYNYFLLIVILVGAVQIYGLEIGNIGSTNQKNELIPSFRDNHVVVYYNSGDILSNSTLKLFSKCWAYAKTAYGPLAGDTILYIYYHVNDSCSNSNLDPQPQNVICIESSPEKKVEIENKNKLDLILPEMVRVVLTTARGVKVWAELEVSKWCIVDILVYDIFLGIGKTAEATNYLNGKLNATYKNVSWLRDWYHPIYKEFKGVQAYRKYLSIVISNWRREHDDYSKYYSQGTLIHFWSGAVGFNLWVLAANVMSWDLKVYSKFLRARKKYTNVTYEDTYQNSPVAVPPRELTEQWNIRGKNHSQILTFCYVDSHLAVYIVPETDGPATIHSKAISKVWRQAEILYGPFTNSSLLYLILHNNEGNAGSGSGCSISSTISNGTNNFTSEISENTVIKCEYGKKQNMCNNDNFLSVISESVGQVILRKGKEIQNWQGFQVAGLEMSQIIAYDLLLQTGEITFADDLLLNAVQTSNNSLLTNDIVFNRMWFYTTYALYGQAVFTNFFKLLKVLLPKRIQVMGLKYARQMNVGEFLHLSSGAANVNLSSLAIKYITKWNFTFSQQFKKAVAEYPEIRYNGSAATDDSELLLVENRTGRPTLIYKVYRDDDIAVYFDCHMNRSISWPFRFLSDHWRNMKSAFETVKQNLSPKLRISLYSDYVVGCKTSSAIDINRISCEKESSDKWEVDSFETRLELLETLTNLTLQSAGSTEAYDTKLFSKLVVFAAHVMRAELKEAHVILDAACSKNTQIQPGMGTFWIQDWYFPIYNAYGGVSVLSRFFFLVRTEWARGPYPNKKMNFGQLVHFWSASAGENLFELAQTAFGFSSDQHQAEWERARKDFPSLKYSCYNCRFETSILSGDQSKIEIIAISAGSTCAIIAAIIIPFLIYRRKLNKLEQKMRQLTEEEIKEFFDGSPSVVESDGEINASIVSKPFNKDYEMEPENLIICNG